jgi:hypothetical protein
VLHQRLVNFPELSRGHRRVLCQLGSLYRDLAIADGLVPKDVTHSVTEPTSQSFDHFMDRVTILAGVAAVLDKR